NQIEHPPAEEDAMKPLNEITAPVDLTVTGEAQPPAEALVREIERMADQLAGQIPGTMVGCWGETVNSQAWTEPGSADIHVSLYHKATKTDLEDHAPRDRLDELVRRMIASFPAA